MKRTYLFGIIAALLVVLVGIFLLGRDGTEEQQSPTPDATPPLEETSELPINAATNTDDIVEEPLLEEGDPATTPPTEDLEDTVEETERSDTSVVTYTDAGFSPKTITIAEGDTVTFVNNSSRNMWVASNIHPTHNEYPEESDGDCLGSSFDACAGVSSGESWSFTFDRVGEWGYHNHLNPSRTGTVIVE